MIPKKTKDKIWALTQKMYKAKIVHTGFKPEKDIEDHGVFYRVWFNDKEDHSTHIAKILKKDVEK